MVDIVRNTVAVRVLATGRVSVGRILGTIYVLSFIHVFICRLLRLWKSCIFKTDRRFQHKRVFRRIDTYITEKRQRLSQEGR